VAQPGRSRPRSTAVFLKDEVDKVLQATGAQPGGADRQLARRLHHPQLRAERRRRGCREPRVLGGNPNHGVWAVPDPREQRVLGATGFLQQLNAPKNANGDEVTPGPVKWLTLRSDNNDKYAQPDGVWIGDPASHRRDLRRARRSRARPTW
jgi:triacylglycerol lipase